MGAYTMLAQALGFLGLGILILIGLAGLLTLADWITAAIDRYRAGRDLRRYRAHKSTIGDFAP